MALDYSTDIEHHVDYVDYSLSQIEAYVNNSGSDMYGFKLTFSLPESYSGWDTTIEQMYGVTN